MQSSLAAENRTSARSVRALFERVRRETEALCAPLSTEDYVVQSMPDASPTKWHLAHTTWFFESFILEPHSPDYEPFNPQFGYLFNSYYNSVGQMHLRPHRGLLTRPTVEDVYAYRDYVNVNVAKRLDDTDDPGLEFLVKLGCHHEQQHQELILTDIKHVLFQNPLLPAYADLPQPARIITALPSFEKGATGIRQIGHVGEEFAFDNETPRHDVLLYPHAVANRSVTNGEFRDFIADGGYANAMLWLSDGWTTVRNEDWQRPLYWLEDLSREFTLGGVREIDPNAPVCHLSYFEADAFARWAGARLPTEAEWECAAADQAIAGNFVESGYMHPVSSPESGNGYCQLFGDVWEWTQSAYAAYPGFEPLGGSLGEYNGKFMCGQFVLRGGSCATPVSHVRPTYRNFFYPHQRWQFSGLRLAHDL